MEEFTTEELAKYNGKDGEKCYIAYKGKVYDVTESMLWEDGDHQGMHEGGIDLTADQEDAPHDDDVLEDLPVVGTLKA
ncbi:cytochrome b5 domain-containing protein [Methanococcoides alaskense]|uniref:Heme/steroid binding protein n=1 Tax=Methanococcoides alaskense TaxID=325778 RepID=A0AA90TYN3_9EURY|nr:cytochrome b5 domain-containing protein [Methanococcoides alaskense]MDA0524982.1 cytochrome B5 [Methanococcoides alaskense]MDR6222103.1 putative heme/steroid binding protein [Methanococcoides alaskense]